MMALSSGAFTKGTVLGPIPWKVELGLVFSNCPLPAHQVVQTSPKFQPGRQREAHVPSVPTGRDTRTWKPRVQRPRVLFRLPCAVLQRTARRWLTPSSQHLCHCQRFLEPENWCPPRGQSFSQWEYNSCSFQYLHLGNGTALWWGPRSFQSSRAPGLSTGAAWESLLFSC